MKPPDHLSRERLVFFSDAIFAIAMTLLVLDIRLPNGAGSLDNGGLLTQLLQLWPKYIAYLISFLVVGTFWVNHVRRFHYILHTDGRLFLLNILLLLLIAFLPFPTAVISESGNRTATVFYALAMASPSLMNLAIMAYAARGGRLTGGALPPGFIRHELLRGLVAPGIFLLSVPVAFVNADAAKFFWLLIIPGLIVMN